MIHVSQSPPCSVGGENFPSVDFLSVIKCLVESPDIRPVVIASVPEEILNYLHQILE